MIFAPLYYLSRVKGYSQLLLCEAPNLDSHQVWLLLKVVPRWSFLLPMLRLSVHVQAVLPVVIARRLRLFGRSVMGEIPDRFFVICRSLSSRVSSSFAGLNVFAGCKYVGLCPLHCST